MTAKALPFKYVVRSGDRYYRDTRNESGHGTFSDIFTSSTIRSYATHYDSKEEADEWATEFLSDSPYTIECVDD